MSGEECGKVVFRAGRGEDHLRATHAVLNFNDLSVKRFSNKETKFMA